jgi:SpoVK/Ycf46/Vps4 family AAA+-type ATPase
MADDALIASLLEAVERAVDDVPLRVHLAGLLLGADRAAEALEHCAAALHLAPGDPAALMLLASISAALNPSSPTQPHDRKQQLAADGPDDFDWKAAEQQVQAFDVVSQPASDPDAPRHQPAVTMADVGGMEHVKAEIKSSFLIPMANPELRAAYGALLGGGLLLYGPPGCGKTFLARAVAGELGASFVAVSLADVLDMWLGASERNIKALFDSARAHRPSVIFFDEIDAIGQRRSNLRNNPAMRGTVNQLLSEMDGATANNDGVFVLAATNQPWDVDPALRRPGRFDRVLFVSPPDLDARIAILKVHLRSRPLGPLDLNRLAKETDGYSGADLARLCEVATRTALADAAATGKIRPVLMSDLDQARNQSKSTTGEWLVTARNAATFANLDGTYDDLEEYLKRRRR